MKQSPKDFIFLLDLDKNTTEVKPVDQTFSQIEITIKSTLRYCPNSNLNSPMLIQHEADSQKPNLIHNPIPDHTKRIIRDQVLQLVKKRLQIVKSQKQLRLRKLEEERMAEQQKRNQQKRLQDQKTKLQSEAQERRKKQQRQKQQKCNQQKVEHRFSQSLFNPQQSDQPISNPNLSRVTSLANPNLPPRNNYSITNITGNNIFRPQDGTNNENRGYTTKKNIPNNVQTNNFLGSSTSNAMNMFGTSNSSGMNVQSRDRPGNQQYNNQQNNHGYGNNQTRNNQNDRNSANNRDNIFQSSNQVNRGNFTLSQNRYQNNYTNALHLGNQSGTLSNTELLYSFQNIATTQVAQQSIFNPVINNNNNNNNRNRSKANDRRKDKI